MPLRKTTLVAGEGVILEAGRSVGAIVVVLVRDHGPYIV